MAVSLRSTNAPADTITTYHSKSKLIRFVSDPTLSGSKDNRSRTFGLASVGFDAGDAGRDDSEITCGGETKPSGSGGAPIGGTLGWRARGARNDIHTPPTSTSTSATLST